MLRSRIVRRSFWLVVALLVLAPGCKKKLTGRDMTFDVTWAVMPDAGPCGAQAHVELRYVIAPSHFQTVCSTAIADLLKKGGQAKVPLVLQVRETGFLFHKRTNTSVCGLAGVDFKRLPGGGCMMDPAQGSTPNAGYSCKGTCPESDRVPPWKRLP